MNKKLIITEQQYKNLKFFLLESSFDKIAKNVIKKGDIITITNQGKKFNFLVIDNNAGQILMDVNDKDSDYFGKRASITSLSFNDNNLELFLASDKQKEEQPPQPKNWSKWVLKDVENIEVFRDGKLIDGTNYESEENKQLKQRFIESLLSLNEGDRVILETAGKLNEIYLDFIGRTNDIVQFSLGEDTQENLGNPNISSIEMSLNDKDVVVTENGFITVKILSYESKDGNMEKQESKIQNIRDFVITNAEDDEEDTDEEDIDGEDGEDEKDYSIDNKKLLAMLTNDPELKLAMLNFSGKMTPTARASFWNEFKKEKGHDSAGWIKVKGLLNTYGEKKATERLGNNFLKNGKIFFEVLDEVNIDYEENGQNKRFTLDRNNVYRDENSVFYKGFDDSNLEQSQYDLRLENRGNFEIMVKDKTETPNVYICDVIKLIRVKRPKQKTITERSEPQKDVEIRFINSDGYKSETTQKTDK